MNSRLEAGYLPPDPEPTMGSMAGFAWKRGINMAEERAGVVTMRGNPVTLVGKEVKVGDPAPNFTVINTDLKPVSLEDFNGKVKVLVSVPSLDTGVCDQETRRFNEEATKMGDNVVVLVFSMDLPFAQKRWCAAAGVDRVITLSDHRDASFGKAYGVLMKENRLLARAVFVADQDDRITYVEYVPEIANFPNFDSVIAAVNKLTG